MKLYILLGLGFGNNESAFEPLGVYSSRDKANKAKNDIIGRHDDGGDVGLEFRIDEYDLDDCSVGF